MLQHLRDSSARRDYGEAGERRGGDVQESCLVYPPHKNVHAIP